MRAAAFPASSAVAALDGLVEHAVELADLFHVGRVVGIAGDLHAGGRRVPWADSDTASVKLKSRHAIESTRFINGLLKRAMFTGGYWFSLVQ